MTGWQPASLRATQLPYCCRYWPLTQDRWIVGRLQKCVHLSARHAYVDSDYLLVGLLMLPPSVWSLPRLSAIRGSLPPARSLGRLLLHRRAADQWCLYHQRMPGSGLTYRRWFVEDGYRRWNVPTEVFIECLFEQFVVNLRSYHCPIIEWTCKGHTKLYQRLTACVKFQSQMLRSFSSWSLNLLKHWN